MCLVAHAVPHPVGSVRPRTVFGPYEAAAAHRQEHDHSAFGVCHEQTATMVRLELPHLLRPPEAGNVTPGIAKGACVAMPRLATTRGISANSVDGPA